MTVRQMVTLRTIAWVIAIAIGITQPAFAREVDTVNSWSLNAPSQDCFRFFAEYHHEASGWVYINAGINCTSGTAFIEYDRKIHKSEMS